MSVPTFLLRRCGMVSWYNIPLKVSLARLNNLAAEPLYNTAGSSISAFLFKIYGTAVCVTSPVDWSMAYVASDGVDRIKPAVISAATSAGVSPLLSAM